MKFFTKQPSIASNLYFGLFLILIYCSLIYAQDNSNKPIRLIFGDVIPQSVKPSEVKFNSKETFEGKYFRLIQFKQIPGEIERKNWEDAGLYLTDYLPDNTYFAVIDAKFNLSLLTDKATTIIGIDDVFKMEADLAQLRLQKQSTNKLVVSYYATLDLFKIISDLNSRGVIIERHRNYSKQLDILINPGQLDEIVALPYIQFAGPQPEEPVLEGYDHRNSTGRSNYINSGYNNLNYNGSGVVIAISEGGTVDNLVDAKGRLTELESGSPSSHKIGVMKNAAGAGNLDPSNRNNAWGATLLSSDAQDYIDLITTNNVRFFNHSYGWTISGGYDLTARDHDLRIASYPLHLIVYSSGNSGTSTGYAPYNFSGWANITGQPKQNKNHFAIGALNSADELTSFSSRGPMYDGRIIPQLVIEGIEGTSDAAPKVTGLMGMLAGIYKDKNSGTEAPATLLRGILMNTADDLENPGPDYRTGYGRPNMRRAYNVVDNSQFVTGSVSNWNTNSHSITVPANVKQVRVMLVWPDVAAAVSANPAIVNDLDLLVIDPSAGNYNPWVLNNTPNEININLPAVRDYDSLNTMEQVTVDDPESGEWTIEVTGFKVPSGPQTYYLTYEFLYDELYMTFPLKDNRLESGDSYYLRWDSYGTSGTFTLDYQLDGGSWVNIVSGYDETSRNYQWTAPAFTDGIHTIKFRVQRGALSSESDVCYIGDVPANLALQWACGDGAGISWDAVAGATEYKVYRVGTYNMEEVTTNITFDGTSAILTDLSTLENEYLAVSAVTGSNEGPRTQALTKEIGDYNCWNIKTVVAYPINETGITLNGLVNPHNSALTSIHFEYGPTASYGSSTSNITITATGHTEEAVSANISSLLTTEMGNVMHYRLVANKDGQPVYGDDQQIRLPSGYAVTLDGTDDYLDFSDNPNLPIYRNGTGTAYTITFWIKGSQAASSGQVIYSEGSSTNGDPRLIFQTSGSYPNGVWVMLFDDDYTLLVNSSRNVQLLDDQWHHFAWVDENGSIKIYIDGNQNGSVLSYTPGNVTLDRSSFGARLTASASNFFPGTVDEITMWDKALSVSEIRNIMHQSLQGNETNLKAYYRFDDGSEDRVFDVVSATEATLNGGSVKNLSTAPLGTAGQLVNTNAQTVVGDAGKQLQVTITSPAQPSTVDYLGIYRTGDGIGPITTEDFGSSGVTQRADIIWGIADYGTVTANLVIDYSLITGIDNSFQIQLLKRTDPSGTWSNVTNDFVHDESARTFSKTGVVNFSEFSIGDAGDNALPVALNSFTATPGNAKVDLNWVTESEVNNLGFNILRSTFKDSGYIEISSYNYNQQLCGAGNSTQKNEYTFCDENVTNEFTYWYKLVDVDMNGTPTMHQAISATPSSNISSGENLPTRFALHNNYPNPFNPVTKISFDVPVTSVESQKISFTIYNNLGQIVRRLYSENLAAGYYEISWDGRNEYGVELPSGVYFLQMNADSQVWTKKMILLR